ncbi:MAG: hypothetical protein HC800_04065 [Phormidesmis sp. RL_2_1]|nr:hypothetical protein [Phormidesmis sp. RL_2_1]
MLQQQQQVQQSLNHSQSELSRLEAKLEQLIADEKELANLAADVARQTELEAGRKTLQQQIQAFANGRFQKHNLSQQAEVIAQEIEQIDGQLKRLNHLQSTLENIPQWEQQLSRLQQQLSRIDAAQQFEQELRSLIEKGQQQQGEYRQQVAMALKTLEAWVSDIAGISSEAIAPVKAALFQGGMLSKATLTGLNNILADLTAQTNQAQIKQQQRELHTQLQLAYAQKAEVMGIGSHTAKQAQLTTQQAQIQQSIAQLDQQLTTESETVAALDQIEKQLQQLENPQAKQQLLIKKAQTATICSKTIQRSTSNSSCCCAIAPRNHQPTARL